jgi:hypothetical protein
MKRPVNAVLFTLSCLAAGPLFAQTQIGGGTCSSSSLSATSTYAFSLSGRQVSSSGNFANVFQANGSATFDGLSKVTMTMSSGTTAAVSTPLTWSGTYSLQSNCVGVVTITSGGSATLNLVLFASGVNFLLTGSDATYSYTGNGNTQPTGCSASLLSGVYTFTGTGFTLSGGSVNGVGNATGLLQFDGQGNLTMNVMESQSGKAATPLILTGSYSISSNCLGSATLADSSKANSYVMGLSVYTATALYSSDIFTTFAQSGKLLISGASHAIYGQPTATPADRQNTSEEGL